MRQHAVQLASDVTPRQSCRLKPHASYNHVQCVSPRGPQEPGEQTVPSVPSWHWSPDASAVSPMPVNASPVWDADTGPESGQGNVSPVCLTHTHTNTQLLPQTSEIQRTHPGLGAVLILENAGSCAVTCHYGGSNALQSCHKLLKIDTASYTVWTATFKVLC